MESMVLKPPRLELVVPVQHLADLERMGRS